MKNRISIIGVVLFMAFGITTALAQQAIVPTGGNASGSSGTVAYTVGQLVYTTQSDAMGTIAQGVQQPFEILVMTAVNNPALNLILTAFPNPTTGSLTLQVGHADISNLKFELFDISGKIIETRKIFSPSEIICFDHLPAAMYFLKVSNTNQEIKSFKIIKN